MEFWLFRKLDSRMATIYVSAQLAGAIIGSLPLLAWGPMGRSVAFGATLPSPGWLTLAVLLGEIITTFTMVSLLTVFIGFRRIRPFTPGIFRFCMRSWSIWRRCSLALARIPLAALVRRSFPASGKGGGSLAWVH